MTYRKYFAYSLIIFIIAFFTISVIVVHSEQQNKKDEYKMFAGFGGTPNISQIRRPWGRVALGPDYY
jgi:hypothetical protein